MTKQQTKKRKIKKTCKQCGEVFFTNKWDIAHGKGVVCSPECSAIARKQVRVQRTCKCCGKEFFVRQYQLIQGEGVFCSRECYHKSPNRPKVQRTCKQCGIKFLAHQCNIDKGMGLFCGQQCAKQASVVPRLQRSCKQCGKTFLARRNQVERGKGIFCSRKCRQESQKRQSQVVVCQCCGKVFADHKRLRQKYCSQKCYHASRPKKVKKQCGGRPHEHDKWRLAVILRDKKCVRCGAIENLQAHHLKHWKHNSELRYDIENGAALCPLCHHAQHPYLPLERFVTAGGKSVKYCVVCENAFLVKKENQSVCSRKCGWKRKQQASAMQRRPA